MHTDPMETHMLEKGDRAPDFTLPDQDGKPRKLADLLAGQALILYFYPADFTPGCTREACDLRDLHTQILGAGLRVVGISPQSVASHGKFRDQYGLPFTLLSDEDKTVIRAYGVDGPLGIGVRRATYLLDAKGKVLDAVLADLRIARHREFVERAIAARGGKA
jgi:peroxiredoxin Q/BCP